MRPPADNAVYTLTYDKASLLDALPSVHPLIRVARPYASHIEFRLLPTSFAKLSHGSRPRRSLSYLKTVKDLEITVPISLLGRADEVIE